MPIEATIGALSFPLEDTGASTLADLDAGRDILLGLMEAAANYELAARWEDAIVGTPLAEYSPPPVHSTLPLMPDPDIAGQVGVKFPVMCCYRGEQLTTEGMGLDLAIVRGQLIIDYILAPASAGTTRKIHDVFKALIAIGYSCAETGGHTAYALDETHTTQAKNVLGPGVGCANFSEITLKTANYGVAKFSPDSPKYLACSIVFDVGETIVDDSGDSDGDYDGATVTHDLGEPGDTVDDFIVFQTDPE